MERNTDMYRLGFIGCGNMGSAIARAAVKEMEPSEILLANRTRAKAESLAAELGCIVGENLDVARKCRFIFLGVKPNMLEEMLKPLQETLRERYDREKKANENLKETGKELPGNDLTGTGFVLVTMAVGVSIADICRMAGGVYPVIRIMPNTPVSIQKGMTLACASPEVNQDQMREFCQIMGGTGVLDFIPEKLIDAGSALSGCGPAYVYLFIEALADGAVECGLPRAKAIEYACQTLIGSASLVLESGSHPGALKDAVCSPGGTTIAGVHALERGGFRCAAMDAVKAAYDKTAGIAK
ncbi:MAG: pyrroline-5-carboxylate reductase [Clostridiales bacterium]|nr:pyrroline-5-carboxylate reductase [Clostridiales bacterium]